MGYPMRYTSAFASYRILSVRPVSEDTDCSETEWVSRFVGRDFASGLGPVFRPGMLCLSAAYCSEIRGPRRTVLVSASIPSNVIPVFAPHV